MPCTCTITGRERMEDPGCPVHRPRTMHIHGIPWHIGIDCPDSMPVKELHDKLYDAGYRLTSTRRGEMQAVPIDSPCFHPTMVREKGHWHCQHCPATLTDQELEEGDMLMRPYRPALHLDEPAPGGGRKRMHQDLSFPEEEI